MNWKEIKQAFKDQAPVLYRDRSGVIRCKNIEQIGMKCVNGRFFQFAAGRDMQSNCLYFAPPESFDFAGGGAGQ